MRTAARVAVAVFVATASVACAKTEVAAPERRVAPAWSWTAPVGYVGMPAADARGIVATYAGRLVALDSSGRDQWQVEDPELRDVAALLVDDLIVMPSEQGLAAYGRDDGQLRWRVDLGRRSNTPALVSPGLVVTTTWDRRLIGVDLARGTRRWDRPLPDSTYGPPAAGGGLAFASWDGGVLAVDGQTGEPRWQAELPAGEASSPAVVGGVVVVVAGGRAAYAFDEATGTPRWRAPLRGEGSAEVPPAPGPDGTVVVADRLGNVAALALATGERRWAADGDGAAVRGGPVVTGETVALPVDAGRLLVVDAGGHRQVLDPPGRVSGAAATPDGLVVFATREAETNAIEAFRF